MNDAFRAEGVSIRMTGGDDDPGIPVADAIELLRDELQAALEKGTGQPVQFGIPDVTLTISVVAGKSKDAVGKIRWWVIEAGGSGKWSLDVTQCPAHVRPIGYVDTSQLVKPPSSNWQLNLKGEVSGLADSSV